ncbi:hypothetical protein RUM43_010692 [Polyplax serrata]|uniref:Uncharacterized protein n=1 Tax=Polyplax serrata TaxID=468196 RepID=A0AAN8S876_POLSC
MRFLRLLVVSVVFFEFFVAVAHAQDFEFPVQLIGFPVIVLAVKISNFVKKLAYAVNPATYQKRSKRSTFPDDGDITQIEKKLVAEMGEGVCVYEKVCEEYALKANKQETENSVLDWDNVFAKYEDAPEDTKRFYLLSVFLGDIVASPNLCRQLAKRGRSCHQ